MVGVPTGHLTGPSGLDARSSLMIASVLSSRAIDRCRASRPRSMVSLSGRQRQRRQGSHRPRRALTATRTNAATPPMAQPATAQIAPWIGVAEALSRHFRASASREITMLVVAPDRDVHRVAKLQQRYPRGEPGLALGAVPSAHRAGTCRLSADGWDQPMGLVRVGPHRGRAGRSERRRHAAWRCWRPRRRPKRLTSTSASFSPWRTRSRLRTGSTVRVSAPPKPWPSNRSRMPSVPPLRDG